MNGVEWWALQPCSQHRRSQGEVSGAPQRNGKRVSRHGTCDERSQRSSRARRAVASDCERRRGLERQEPLPRIVASIARGINGLDPPNDRLARGGRAHGDGRWDDTIDLVVPGRPTGSSASGRLRKTQDKDGRADAQAPPLPGLFVCPFAESLGCVGCYFGFWCCCVVAVGCGCFGGLLAYLAAFFRVAVPRAALWQF